MVNTSSGWRQQRLGMVAQAQAQHPQSSEGVQDATTRTVRTMACVVCKAIYTPTPAHQQLVMAPHIVLESAFMSMCHFCFRCRRTACPDCWDAVHGVCGACVIESHLPFRTQVKALNNVMPSLPEQQVAEAMHTASVLVCIQHGRFHAESSQLPSSTCPSPPIKMRRSVRVASPEIEQHGAQQATTMAPIAAVYAASHEEDEAESKPEQHEQSKRPVGWIAETLSTIERWLTGVLLALLLTIVTLVVIAEASHSANAQIMHLFNIDIRSEIAYLVSLIRQLQW